MAIPSNPLLLSLKDFSKCNEQLSSSVRNTLLGPFQSDGKRISPQEIKIKAQQYAPLAIRIVNQNIQSLKTFKEWKRSHPGNHSSIKHCLIDTSFYATQALQQMKSFTALKPMDMEKTTSNLICKLVDLGEWARALDELRRFRCQLADLANVPLEQTLTLNLRQGTTTTNKSLNCNDSNISLPVAPKNAKDVSPSKQRRALLPSNQSAALTSLSLQQQHQRGTEVIFAGGRLSTMSSTDEDMLTKYADLFTFPMEARINDKSMVLLILAYQMNAIRAWCDIHDGTLLKYLAVLLDRPGNFIDWCKSLMASDEPMAKKQLDLLQRHLFKLTAKSPSCDDPLQIFALQVLALQAGCYSGAMPTSSTCDRFVRLAVGYEKSSAQVNYDMVQKYCFELIHLVKPQNDNPADLEAYLVFCEYCAYIAKKAHNQDHMAEAYKTILESLEVIPSSKSHYYHIANITHARLSLCALQTERAMADDPALVMTLSKISKDIQSLLQTVNTTTIPNDGYTEQTVFKLCKTLNTFRHNCNKYWDSRQSKSTVSSPASITSLGSLDPADHETTAILTKVLEQCAELILVHLDLIKTMGWISGNRRMKTIVSPKDILLTYVDTMILLSKTAFDVKREVSHYQAFDYLAPAEQICTDNGFASGYRWISSAYYTLGAAMVTAGNLSSAVYPLRKACTLLEKDEQRSQSDAGRLQLTKRYEVLGTCCQKIGDFEGALSNFRLALARVPQSNILAFIDKADSLTVARLAVQQPLIPKLMDRFLRTSVGDHEQGTYASGYLKMAGLTPIQKAVVYECELKIFLLLSHRMNLSKEINNLIAAILNEYSQDRYPIRRARVLLTKVQMIHTQSPANEQSIKTALNLVLEAQELLKSSKDYGQDSNLLNYRRHYLALSFSWFGILRRELNDMNDKPFVTALHHWGMLLKKVTSITSPAPTSKEDLEHVCACVDDLDRLYDHFRVLSDLFAVMGFDTLRINVLRMMLKLNNGLRDSQSDHVSDSIMILTDIGTIYTNMGYSGKARIEYTHLNQLLPSARCSTQARLYFTIYYSYHLSTLGEFDDSKSTFNKARHQWNNLTLSLNQSSSKSIRSYREQATIHFLAADSHLTRSLVSMYSESLDVAIRDCTSCFQILSAYLKANKAQRSHRQDSSSASSESFFLADERKSRATQNDMTSSLASELTFKEFQWTLTVKLAACLQRLGHLHMVRGTWRDAQYFLTQGRQLGEKVKSNALVFRFQLLLSESYLQSGQLDKSRASLEQANDLQPKGPRHLHDEARLKSVIGNVDANQMFLEESIVSYDNVDELLRKIMEPGYISSIEKLVDCDDDFERQVSIAREAHAMESTQDSLQFECQTIQLERGLNTICKAVIMGENGLASAGLSLLDKNLNSQNMQLREDLLNATVAHIRLALVNKNLKESGKLEEVLMLPTLYSTPSSSRRLLTKSNSSNLIREHLSNAVERLNYTHRSCANLETVKLVQQICLDLGTGTFFKSQLSSASAGMVSNHAAMASYYFDMAKNISLRREMQTCIDQKLRVPSSLAVNGLAWPDDLELSTDQQQVRTQRNLIPANILSREMRSYYNTLQGFYQQEHEYDEGEFQTQFINILPSPWTVCSLSFDPNTNALYVAQYRAGQPPLVVKLPIYRTMLQRQQALGITGGPTGLGFDEAIGEFQDIIQHSDHTIHTKKTSMTKKQIEDWWMTRSQLNTRMKKLLEQIESSWLGGFKGMLCGQFAVCKPLFEEFKIKVQHILAQHVKKSVVDLSDGLLHMILRLGLAPEIKDVNDVVYFLLSQPTDVKHTGAVQPYTNCPAAVVNQISQQLIDALKHYHDEALLRGIDTMQRIENSHVILIPDKHTQSLPLENLPIMRQQPTSRVPCLSFLRDRILYGHARANEQANEIKERSRQGKSTVDMKDEDDEINLDSISPYAEDWTDITVQGSKTYYVLNPSGDLKHTQAEFQHTFATMPTWEGHVQKKPSELECRSVLKQKDIYMYFGHSAGQSMIRGQVIRQLPRCPVAILMGCSSGALQSQGDYDPHGYVLNYLLGGSASVVANLWDVTDKSIDRLSKKMMERWGLLASNDLYTGDSLVEALTKSRDECPLPYLIGAAPIVYGVPVYLSDPCSL